MSVDNSKNKSSEHGGARLGSGRPKGSMNAASKERMVAKAAFISRVNKHADELFNSQLNLAVGETYLMVKRTEGVGKDRKVWHESVSDPQTIIDYLDGELEGNESIDDGEHYYYMTTKPANGLAIDSLLNRSFGRAEEKIQLNTNGEGELGSLSDEELETRIERYLKRRTSAK